MVLCLIAVILSLGSFMPREPALVVAALGGIVGIIGAVVFFNEICYAFRSHGAVLDCGNSVPRVVYATRTRAGRCRTWWHCWYHRSSRVLQRNMLRIHRPKLVRLTPPSGGIFFFHFLLYNTGR